MLLRVHHCAQSAFAIHKTRPELISRTHREASDATVQVTHIIVSHQLENNVSLHLPCTYNHKSDLTQFPPYRT